MAFDAAQPNSPTHDVAEHGFHVFADGVEKIAAAALLAKVKAVRTFDAGLFLDEAVFDADPQYTGVNPMPGRNLLETFEPDLAFIEQDPAIVSALTELLGEAYACLNRKFVCGVPQAWVPEWVQARIQGNPVNNLGPYVKPAYRDITYFYGIDFHQDLIDYKAREADFVTLYVYLHPVGERDAPLFLLEDSHKLAGTVFPHDLAAEGEGRWLYKDGRGRALPVRQHLLVGDTGYAALWHACTLHGTQPDAADHERISVRYLFAKTTAARSGIDVVNDTLEGPLSLEATRRDLADNGAAVMKANTVNKA